MRASWFRGRAPELDAAHDLEVPAQDGGTTPTNAGAAGPSAGSVVPPVRPASGNQTF